MPMKNDLLFKEDLLKWASQILKVPIQSINDFRNGVYFIQLLLNIDHKYSKNQYFDKPGCQSEIEHNLILIDLILQSISRYDHNPYTYPNCQEQQIYFDLDVIRNFINSQINDNYTILKAQSKKCQKILKSNSNPIAKLSNLYELFNVNKAIHILQDIEFLQDEKDIFKLDEEITQLDPEQANYFKMDFDMNQVPNVFQYTSTQQDEGIQNLHKIFNDQFHSQNLTNYVNRQNKNTRMTSKLTEKGPLWQLLDEQNDSNISSQGIMKDAVLLTKDQQSIQKNSFQSTPIKNQQTKNKEAIKGKQDDKRNIFDLSFSQKDSQQPQNQLDSQQTQQNSTQQTSKGNKNKGNIF